MGTALRFSEAEVEEAIGPLDAWAMQCHAASVALINSDLFSDRFRRVARGTAQGVFGQHSWVVLGEDCYNPNAIIVDVTLWSYDPKQPRVLIDRAKNLSHLPHGSNSIWDAGCPIPGDDEDMPLDLPFMHKAEPFYRMVREKVGRTDRRFWMSLWSSNAMLGFNASALLEAFLDRYPDQAAIVPIDIIGMLTDRNPSGLYLPGDEHDA